MIFMEEVVLKGRGIVKGRASGEALVSPKPISFYGDVDPERGVIVARDHPLRGASIVGKVLIFPRGRGSTVGSYIIYRLKKAGKAPVAIVNEETEPIIAAGCVVAEIPLVDRLDKSPVKVVATGDLVEVDGYHGIVKVIRKEA